MVQNVWGIGAVGLLLVGAFSSSPSYQLQNYGVGSGGTNSASSPSYRLNSTSGVTSGAATTGSTSAAKSGPVQAQQANVPLAPTLDNGSSTYYNKLKVTINKGGSDGSDYTYSIAISTNNFSSTNYLQANGTLGAAAVYQSYTAWGGSSGLFITGLSPGTTYQVKTDAKQGTFSNSAYGPAASASTASPALTFSVTPGSIAFGTLYAGAVTAGNSSVSLGFSTNSGSGGSVYVGGSNGGLKSTVAGYTIPAVSADLGAQSVGFGAQGTTATQSSGSVLAFLSPFNGTGDTVGAPTTTYRQLLSTSGAVTGGSASAKLLGKAAATTPSATDYSETLTFTASANF